jgi:MFS family permease
VKGYEKTISKGGRMPVATINIQPDNTLPGTAQLQTLISGLGTWALMAALAGMLLGAALWALGHHSSNYQQAANGRKGLLVAGFAALIIGAAPALISFFFSLGGSVKAQ